MRVHKCALICAVLMCRIVSAQIVPAKTYLSPDPKPNMKEKYVPLKLIETIGPEIGPDIFIFKPQSVTLDRDGNLYVFDRAQHQVVKMDKNLKFISAFGGKGQGPGEFNPFPGLVFITVGPDNKLYCNDTSAQKIIVFDLDGKYITDYKTPFTLLREPTVDKNGQIYFFSGNDKEITASNQQGKKILNIPLKAKEAYSFLFQKQQLQDGKMARFFTGAFMDSGDLLLYFATSSLMLNVLDNKITAKYRILPEELLQGYNTYINEMLETNKGANMPLFQTIIPDGDTEGVYYLPHIVNYSNNRGLLYQMNLNGDMQKTYYVDYKTAPKMVWFQAKKNGLFYARITGDAVIGIFKEMK